MSKKAEGGKYVQSPWWPIKNQPSTIHPTKLQVLEGGKESLVQGTNTCPLCTRPLSSNECLSPFSPPTADVTTPHALICASLTPTSPSRVTISQGGGYTSATGVRQSVEKRPPIGQVQVQTGAFVGCTQERIDEK